VETARVLLKHGADVNPRATTSPKNTALAEAAFRGNAEVVDLLAQHGASVDAQNDWHWTALHYAANKGHRKVCEVLLKHGAQINAQTPTGQTPLKLAKTGGHADLAAFLASRGARE
jgi:ankyrin repeat protein